MKSVMCDEKGEIIKCVMCGEKPSEVKISNPNDSSSIELWNVCKDCEDFIRRGQCLALECFVQERIYGKFDSKKLAKKWMESPNPKLDKFDKKAFTKYDGGVI